MAVVAAACRKALVNAGWAICLLSCTNGHTDSISSILGSFWSGGAFSGQRALTIELMSRCVQGQEPTENASIKL